MAALKTSYAPARKLFVALSVTKRKIEIHKKSKQEKDFLCKK